MKKVLSPYRRNYCTITSLTIPYLSKEYLLIYCSKQFNQYLCSGNVYISIKYEFIRI